jgi:hypothetical protein
MAVAVHGHGQAMTVGVADHGNDIVRGGRSHDGQWPLVDEMAEVLGRIQPRSVIEMQPAAQAGEIPARSASGPGRDRGNENGIPARSPRRPPRHPRPSGTAA